MPRAEIGSPEWLRAVPARWGLRKAEACRVMGIAPSTFRAKCSGRLPISERLIGRIVDVEMLLMAGYPPFGWPWDRVMPDTNQLVLTIRTIDHYRTIIAAQIERALRLSEAEPETSFPILPDVPLACATG